MGHKRSNMFSMVSYMLNVDMDITKKDFIYLRNIEEPKIWLLETYQNFSLFKMFLLSTFILFLFLYP